MTGMGILKRRDRSGAHQVSRYFLFYSLCYICYFCSRYLEYTNYVKKYHISGLISAAKAVAYLGVLCVWLVDAIYNDVKMSTMIGVVLSFFFLYTTVVYDTSSITAMLIFSITFHKKYLDRFMKLNFYLQLLMFLFCVGSCVAGIIPEAATSAYKLGAMTVRHSMGFNYPGQFAMQFNAVLFCFFYVRRERIRLRDIFLCTLCLGAVFYVSRVLMSAGLGVLFILVQFLIRKSRSDHMVSRPLFLMTPTLCVMITFLLVYLTSVGNAAALAIDRLCTSRFSISVRTIANFGVRPLGSNGYVNNIDKKANIYQVLDSEYVYDLVAYGYLFLTGVLVLSTLLMFGIYRYRCLQMEWMWILLFINGIVNNGIFNLVMNPYAIITFPYAAEAFMRKKKRAVGKKEQTVQDGKKEQGRRRRKIRIVFQSGRETIGRGL